MFDFVFRNNWWNKANEVWMSSALSNPKTQIINFASTAKICGLNLHNHG